MSKKSKRDPAERALDLLAQEPERDLEWDWLAMWLAARTDYAIMHAFVQAAATVKARRERRK